MSSLGRAFLACFFQPILGNDRLVVEAEGQRGAFVVPDIQPRIDRVTDEVTGRAKPGTTVQLDLAHSDGFGQAISYPLDAQADGNGHYSADFSGISEIIGGDNVGAFWTNGHDAVTSSSSVTPFINYGAVSSTVVGAANRGDDVRIDLLSPGGGVRAVAHAGSPTVFPFFEAAFIDADGSHTYPVAGDRIVGSIAGDLELLVSRVSVHGDTAADRVWGRCMPASPYLFRAVGDTGEEIAFRTGTTDAEGRFSRQVPFDLQRSHFLTLTCRFETGDFVFLDQEI